jgi:glycosyltransferase involved in cell wall biosynthesis
MNQRLLAVSPVDHPGGAENCLLRLLAGLSSKGWQIATTTPGPGRLRDAALERGYTWHPLPLGGLERGAGARAIRAWPRARALSRSVDIVYLNGAVCGRLLPALGSRGATRVLHVHDIVQRVPPFWRRADVILSASKAVASRLAPLKSHVVYGPVEMDPPSAAPPWTRGNGPIVGYVGRLEPRKGALDLVRAAPMIRVGAPGTHVVIVGDDPYGADPEYSRAVIESDQIEHHAWRENAPGLMRHMDVLVLPSYEEPFGTVLAEAMAVGTPVVATRVDGLPEVVEDGVTGRLVPPGQPERLAAAVLDVLEHKEHMGGAARERARRFDAGDYVERVESLIAR